MLGPMSISRAGHPVVLPNSRKVRALIAYLALAPTAVARSHLCELLWDVPNDPRGELRWCLSKLRGLLDENGRSRVVTSDGAVALDLGDFFIDAAEIAASEANGMHALGPERLRRLAGHFEGDFLEGLEIGRSPLFESWLGAQRRRFSGIRAMLAERGVKSVAQEGFGAPGVVVCHTADPEIRNGSKFAALGLQTAAGVPLMVDEGPDFGSFRLGLFGLDKLKDVPASLARLQQAFDRVF